MNKNRFAALDIFKGWAIVLMVLFHLCYDLNYFHYISIDLQHDKFWLLARYIIVTMFLLGVGMSLTLAHTPIIKWDKVRKRIVLLGGASLLISITTYVVFPHSWVYFGILHFILFASLLGLLFLQKPLLSLFLAILILLASTLGWLELHWLFLWLKEPLHLPKYTEDFVPIFPWFAVILFGMSSVSYGYYKTILGNRVFNPTLTHNRVLAKLGRNALVIYLIHQPLLFGFFYLLGYIH